MLDLQLQQILIPLVRDRLIAMSFPVVVKMSYQPTLQGADTDQPDIPGDENPQVYLHFLRDHRYGSPERKSVWNEGAGNFVYTETQIIETTFQVDARVIQDPANLAQKTAGDYVQMTAAILQSSFAIEELRNMWDIGIQRITDIRRPYFVDDKGNHEQSPSFDFTVTHKQSIIDAVAEADPINANIHRV